MILFLILTIGEDDAQVCHPPHLSSTWRSALIPFCAFKTDLNFSKNNLALTGLTFPLCSSFLPTFLEGQLCYQLMLNRTSGLGKENELMLILDYNEDLSIHAYSDEKRNATSSKTTLNLETAIESIQGEAAKIQIDTVPNHVGFGGGMYRISGVKKVTATADFLSMPLEIRKCAFEAQRDCRIQKLKEECNCVPWEVTGFQVLLS